ncbi:MAG: hypothetical protein QNI84_01375 [Henriciella sp.]|nr:hypothetical protein [Henriciella sp.]
MKLTKFSTWTSTLVLAGAAVALSGTAQASNTQTEAGRSVSNTFTLDYSVDVGGTDVAQPTITNETGTADPNDVELPEGPTLFTVDRKVDHSIIATNSTLSVAPDTTATLTFELTNEGNDTQAYSFSIADLDDGGDTFDAGSVTITATVDTDDDGDLSDETSFVLSQTVIGADPDVASTVFVTEDVPKGAIVLIEVSGTVASTVDDAFTDDITLIAEARNPTAWVFETLATGEEAEVTLADVGANDIEGAAQNVLADNTGVATVEGDSDGLFAVTGIIEVISPDLTATKDVIAILQPGVDDAPNAVTAAACASATAAGTPKAIPGACIEYFITVTNTGLTADATNLDIQDVLPAEVTFAGVSLDTSTGTGFEEETTGAGVTLNAPAAGTACDGTSATCLIQLTDALLAAQEDGIIRIRAIVD